MSWVGWRLVGLLSLMLEPHERDAVLGDHQELGISPAKAVLDVAGLVARRSIRPAVNVLKVTATSLAYTILILVLSYWFGIQMATAE